MNTLLSAGDLKRHLISSTFKLAALSVLGTAIGLPISIIMARGLGAQGYGVYVYAMTIISLLMMLNQLGVPSLITRSTTRCLVSSEWSTLRSMVARFSQVLALLAVAILLVSGLALWWFADRLSVHKLYTSIWLLPLVPLSVVSGITGAVLYGMNHVLVGGVVGVIGSLLRLVALALLFWLLPYTRFPEYAAAVAVLVSVITCALLGWWLWRQLPKAFYQGPTVYHTRQWLGEAAPFIFLAGIGLINGKIDIFMLGFFVSAEEVANYHIAVRVSALVALGPQIIKAVILPQITAMYQRRETHRLQRMLSACARGGFVFTIAMMAVVLLFGKEVIILLLGREYLNAYPVLMILGAGLLVQTAFGPVGGLAQSTRHEKDILHTLALGSVLNVALNLALIPLYGMTGAAVASLISAIFYNVYLTRRLRAQLDVRCHIFPVARRP